MNQFISNAIQESKKSNGQFKIGCIITDKKGKVISTGYNKPSKSHPFQHSYALRAGVDKKIYLHAEIDALVKCKQTPHTIYIAREYKDGTMAMAKPCPICELAIIEAGIKNIVYTTTNGVEKWILTQ